MTDDSVVYERLLCETGLLFVFLFFGNMASANFNSSTAVLHKPEVIIEH